MQNEPGQTDFSQAINGQPAGTAAGTGAAGGENTGSAVQTRPRC
jgi:hypothetical protein